VEKKKVPLGYYIIFRDPPVSETKIGDGADRRELTDGEVFGGSVFTPALISSRRID